MMTGWKTWLGALLVAASAAVEYLGQHEAAGMIAAVGAALGIVGIGHKVERERRNSVPVLRSSNGRFSRKTD